MFLIKKIGLAMLMTATLMACQDHQASSNAPAQSEQPQTVAPKKAYRVATDATYPPFEFTNERGEIIGLDIDLLNAIAKQQGFEVEYYHHDWDGMFEELKQGKADILASAIAITDEAKEGADLSTHYFASPYAVVALKPEWVKDRAWQTKKIAVGVNDDTEEDLIDEFDIPENQFHSADTLYLGLKDVLKGDAQVAVGDATVMNYRINSPTFTQSNIKFYIKDLQSADPETDKLVFAVKKGNQELLDKINAGLAHLKQTGELDKLLKKWKMHNQPMTASAPSK